MILINHFKISPDSFPKGTTTATLSYKGFGYPNDETNIEVKFELDTDNHSIRFSGSNPDLTITPRKITANENQSFPTTGKEFSFQIEITVAESSSPKKNGFIKLRAIQAGKIKNTQIDNIQYG